MPHKKRYKIALLVLVLVAGIAFGALYFSRFVISENHEISNFNFACAEYGEVMTLLDARGVVEPENEVILLSPSTSVIKGIRRVAGSHVRTGEVILYLDPEPVIGEMERLEDQLEVRKNNLRKTRLSARSTKIELDYNVEMKKLNIASLMAELADQAHLLEVGGLSPAQHEQTKQRLVIAEKDLEMVTERNSIRLKQLEADERGLLLEIKIQERNLEEKKELLKKMNVRASSDGIILSVHGKEGERINAMQPLVRMSDLTTFKITGSVDEKTADAIKTGRDVYAFVGDEKLPGKIGTIKPLVENNRIQFDVHLQESSHQKLMPNLNIDLRIVTMRKDSVLRIVNSSVFEKKSRQSVFVVNNARAFRRDIEIGLTGPDYIEIISGLNEGECVIISDVSPYKNMKEIALQP